MDNPTTDDKGAGAGANFQGGTQAARSLRQTSKVKEGSSGIIESTHIDPLSENSNDGTFRCPDIVMATDIADPRECADDGFANATQTPGRGAGMGQKPYDAASVATEKAAAAAKVAYGTAAGNEAAKQAGKDALYG